MNINKIFKEFFLYGGLGWGVPFFLFYSIWRWIEYKPLAYGFSVFFVVSVIAGCFVGLITKILTKDAEEIKFDFKIFYKSMLLFALAVFIYGVIFRFVLMPNGLDRSFVGTIILLILLLISSIIQKKMIIKKASI
ncbi:hypothetical protein A6M14_03560 [Acinetobacter sp. Ac_877]|uniref:hypothetical protein n=1 Tax=Acinetobacter portensis TaxID=1839785 RepID=UPI00128E3151|nr:hypothetical protein [Acinetobacter portensis]MPW40387.1 hypothetical protein [Acinetobacter portensis]